MPPLHYFIVCLPFEFKFQIQIQMYLNAILFLPLFLIGPSPLPLFFFPPSFSPCSLAQPGHSLPSLPPARPSPVAQLLLLRAAQLLPP
jgi:hypothetical protein